jgi:hypothetical protein
LEKEERNLPPLPPPLSADEPVGGRLIGFLYSQLEQKSFHFFQNYFKRDDWSLNAPTQEARKIPSIAIPVLSRGAPASTSIFQAIAQNGRIGEREWNDLATLYIHGVERIAGTVRKRRNMHACALQPDDVRPPK